MVYLLATIAALVNGISSILQRLGVETAPDDAGLSTRLVAHMFRRPVWIFGFLLMGLGFIAQATALHFGTLAVVQPLLVTEMVFIVLALWLWYSMDLRPRDVLASVAATLGVAGFLAASSPTSGVISPSDRRWAVAALIILAIICLLVVMSRTGPRWWRAMALGAAASVGFAFTAALTQGVTDLVTQGWSPLFTAWQTYALVVMGLGSFFLMQSAFHAGPFAASQSTLILINPFVSIVIGHVLFGDHLRAGTIAVIIEALSLLVMVSGAVGLATSPLIVGVHDESRESQMLAGRGRYARWHARRVAVRAGSTSS